MNRVLQLLAEKPTRNAILVGAIVGAVCLADFLWEGSIGFNLADEGFLWYGAQRISFGEVPLRDFMSYDPGRYYWAALIMVMRGDTGILSLWIAIATIQAVSVMVAVFALWRFAGRMAPEWAFLVVVTLVLWIIPRHKTFDIAMSIVLVTTLAWFVEQPVRARAFVAGVSVGFAAMINRNHGLYGLVGHSAAIALVCFSDQRSSRVLAQVSSWVAGVVVGFSPMVLLMMIYPGFGGAFWESIQSLLELIAQSRNTNLGLAIPWPWLASFDSADWFGSLRSFALGCLFVGMILFGVVGIVVTIHRCLRNRHQSPLFVACGFMAIPYAHHAFSRAEVLHLAQGIFPVLLGSLTWISTTSPTAKWAAGLSVLIVSALVALPAHVGYQRGQQGNWVYARVGSDMIQVDPGTASNMHTIESLVDQFAPASGSTFLAVPYWPGAYALTGRKSPIWEIYGLFPRSRSFEEDELARIVSANPRFAIVQNLALEGREDLRFSNTHPETYQYISTHFAKESRTPFSDSTISLYLMPKNRQ
jgi:hypothetical protein